MNGVHFTEHWMLWACPGITCISNISSQVTHTVATFQTLLSLLAASTLRDNLCGMVSILCVWYKCVVDVFVKGGKKCVTHV